MTDPHRDRIQDVPDVLSVEPQFDGEIRFEIFAGVEVGFKGHPKPDESEFRYQVAVYKNNKRWRELTDDFGQAVELFSEAMNDPKNFRENCDSVKKND